MHGGILQGKRFAVFTALAGLTSAPPAVAQNFDAIGCWVTPEDCVTMESRWASEDQGDDTLVTTFTNRCGGRIYIKYCNERQRQELSWGCETGVLNDRQQVSLSSWGGTTGRSTARWNGSRDAESDKLCGRVVNQRIR